jgi:DNA primase catalytic subunit
VINILIPALRTLAKTFQFSGGEFQPCADYFTARIHDQTRSEFWLAAGIILLAPRIDRGVTVDRDHLLKAPFSLHPTTGLVALPIDLTRMDSPDWNIDHVCVSFNAQDLRARLTAAVQLFESTF